MSRKVYANGMQIAHQAGDAKVTAAFPDVCLSPPPPPAGPVPVPYADTSFARDLKNGSSTVLIDGKPLAVEDSYYETSPLGNEAATRNFGGSLLTRTITGKTYFQAHSMDVLVEGKHVCRHLDLTTSNHGSYPGGTPPFPNLSDMHQLALDRIEQGQCPCCGSEDCAAAFEEGEEPLSMKEALGIDPRKPNFSAKRAEEYKLLRNLKKTACTCNGKVFPSPPCDVFRAPNKARHDAIERSWERYRDTYVKWYEKFHGLKFKSVNQFLVAMLSMVAEDERQDMLRRTTLPRAERSRSPAARRYDRMCVEAKKLQRVNHLTPKQYGGCPTNPDNLQPQQTLCAVCQDIDQFMTDKW